MAAPRPPYPGDGHAGVSGQDAGLPNCYASELTIAAEFLTAWLPFLAHDLCPACSRVLSHRVHSLRQYSGHGAFRNSDVPAPVNGDTCLEVVEDLVQDSAETPRTCDNCATNSLVNDANELSETMKSGRSADTIVGVPLVCMSRVGISQEDELAEKYVENPQPTTTDNFDMYDANDPKMKKKKPSLSREEREYIRFMNSQRKKDFICIEKINGRSINILDGLELHTRIFSDAEQKRIVNYVYALQEKGKRGKLRDRTYSQPTKWMRGKGRVTIQFGCCYNYAKDKNGNPPGILRNEVVDPLPHLFKVMIKRLVGWHVLPPTCVPDSCIVNIYEPGDCIPPHIDNHEFVRPFCTVSFLSECNIVFGSKLKIEGPGEFSGSFSMPLPLGSVLVLKGNGADVAQHCVPAVPTNRISITFRKMDENRQPFGFLPEPDLQGLQPIHFVSSNMPERVRKHPSHVNHHD